MILIGILAVLLLAVCAACGAKEAPPDEAALRQDAEAVAEALLAGEYSQVTARFDQQMTKLVSREALESGWGQVAGSLGAYQGRHSLEGAAEDGHYVVVVTERFRLGGVRLRVVYDGAGRIAGLLCAPVQLEEATMREGCVEVAVTVEGLAGCPLSGSLTLPAAGEKPPVVILLQGSGSSDKNEGVYGNKPFFDIAQGLAENGVATLRYDKRYYAYPEAAAPLGADLSLRDEVLDDLDAAIRLLRADQRVDGSSVYVLGHSLSGMLTPVIATEHPELGGVISMAGSLRPLWEISYDQSQEALAAIDRSALSEADQKTLEAQARQVEADIAVLRGDFSALSNETTLMGIPVGYWKSLKELCGMNYIGEVTMPMLILQGGADFQISPEKDYPLWQETLADRDHVTFRLYPELNHLMMPTQGKRDVSEYAVPGTVDARVIGDIAAFVKETR